jgi:transposase
MRASLKALKQRESPADCLRNQLDLFNHNVLAHDVTDSSALCDKHAESAIRIMNTRQARGLEIATQHEITRDGNAYIVPSQTSSKRYTINLSMQTCTCADFGSHRLKCKHIHATEYQLQRENGATLPIPEKIVKPTYKQEWHEYDQAQINEKARFLELLYALCSQIEEPMQHMGRPRISLADRLFITVYKVYEGLSSRRFMSDVAEAKRRGYLSTIPNFCLMSRCLESEDLTPILKQLIVESSLPLKSVEYDFAVDSSGFSTGVYQRWFDAKWKNGSPYGTNYGKDRNGEVRQQDWVKVHLMCGVKTNIVTSIEITTAHAGDNPQFAPLVEKTAENFQLREVSADKAYSSAKSLQLVLVKGGQPYIPFRRNTNVNSYWDKKQPAVWKKMYHQYMANQDEFAEHYHKRSNVETTFSMIKRKFGERLRSKTRTAQENEVLCKVLCHNLCCVIQSMYELGVEATFATKNSLDAEVV